MFKFFKFSYNSQKYLSSLTKKEMDLKQFVKKLEEYANTKIACSWDNVGLLVEPSEALLVKKVLVTNDLTEPVLEEALKKSVNLIVSYHPAIFSPLKRLTQSDWKQRSIVKCIENRIAVYSPHTAWDSIEGGINDWILKPFDLVQKDPIETVKSLNTSTGFAKTVKINLCTKLDKNKILSQTIEEAKFMSEKEVLGENSTRMIEIEFAAGSKGILNLIDLIQTHYGAETLSTLRIYDQEKSNMKNIGTGRIGHLNEAKKLSEIVNTMKSHFKMNTFRIALGNGKSLESEVKKIGVCAGSGGKLLANLNVDLLITGEMSHHEILHEVQRGVSLIVTDHTNTERGYLQIFLENFTEILNKENNSTQIEILVSEVDRDPLQYI